MLVDLKDKNSDILTEINIPQTQRNKITTEYNAWINYSKAKDDKLAYKEENKNQQIAVIAEKHQLIQNIFNKSSEIRRDGKAT